MPYLNVDLDYFNHRKTVRLVAMLGPGAAEIPIRLWAYCGKYHAETGQLCGYTDSEIEAVGNWRGEPGLLIKTLILPEILLLEKIDSGYQIHDWIEHAGHLWAFKKRAITAAKKRWKKYACSNARKKSSNATTGKVGKVGKSILNSSEEGGVGEETLHIPDWIDCTVWQSYREYRRKIKHPMTEHAERLAIHKLDMLRECGSDPTEVIEQTILAGWSGLFEVKSGKGHPDNELSERTQRILKRGL